MKTYKYTRKQIVKELMYSANGNKDGMTPHDLTDMILATTSKKECKPKYIMTGKHTAVTICPRCLGRNGCMCALKPKKDDTKIVVVGMEGEFPIDTPIVMTKVNDRWGYKLYEPTLAPISDNKTVEGKIPEKIKTEMTSPVNILFKRKINEVITYLQAKEKK